jgi:D-sedoheptulose 7-phosphate isomerase
MQPELEALYPFLGGHAREPHQLERALVESIAAKAAESRATSERFFAEVAPVLLGAASAIAASYRRGGRLLAMGNGGSSCDAAHVAVEFVHPVTTGRPALAAVNLVADVAALSAVGNDVGFEHVFARQVAAHGRAGDALIGISTSGHSANLLAAFARARELSIATIGLTGGDGGAMRSSGLVDHCLIVPSSSIHRIQEAHVTAYHILWDLVHTMLADDRGAANREIQP